MTRVRLVRSRGGIFEWALPSGKELNIVSFRSQYVPFGRRGTRDEMRGYYGFESIGGRPTEEFGSPEIFESLSEARRWARERKVR